MTRRYSKLNLCGLVLISTLKLNTATFGQTAPLVVTADKLHGFPGIVNGPSVFTSGTGSHSGKPGDYGIDFGTSGGTSVHVTNATFLNIAATNDILTFSFWLRRYDLANSSVFWANSPSSGGDSRGFQAHAPWSDGTIYFDAAGGRISAPITDFAGYTGDESWWTNWHQYVFFMNGTNDAEIWIDGQQFLAGVNANPLHTDFTDLYIGSGGTGAGNTHGVMDDFAIFSTAVSSNNINKLYTGVSPTALTGETLLAYWDFDDPPAILPPVGSFDGFSILVNDLGTNVMNTNTITLSLNGTNVAPTTVTKVASTAKINYLLPNPPFPPGSTQYTGISLQDQTGRLFTNASFFVAPQLLVTPGLALPPASVDKTKPGFKIRTYQVDDPSLGDGNALADDILNGKHGPNVANLADAGGVDGKGYFTWTNVINFDIDSTLSDGSFNAPTYTDFNFPGIPGNPVTAIPTEHFACELSTALEFPTAGTYTMVVNSDDGFRTTTGQNPLDYFAALKLGEYDGGRGSADTVFKFYVQQAGLYGFRTLYEQGGGGSALEWFMINSDGTRVLINDTTNSIKAYQWLPSITAAYVRSVSPPNGTKTADPDLVQAIIVDGSNPILTNQVSLQIDGSTVAAARVTKTGAETTVTYRPNPLFAQTTSHTATLLFQDGTNAVSRAWEFTVATYTKDKVQSYVGSFRGNAAYSADRGGHTGNSGDYAIDFGRAANGSLYIKNAGDFLNVAGTNDEMSFSLWVKKYDIANSSTFWANSPSSSAGQRGWQAHTPWSDDTVYFDTAGCCGGTTQRVSESITNLVSYTGTDDWWTNWHHFLFSKKLDDKQIWIDGKMLLDGSNSNPLPTDFTDMYLGAAGDGTGNMHGLIDDFAVYATALGTNDIILLAGGTAPTGLAPSTKLMVYWDFNDLSSNAPLIGIATVNAKVTITFSGSLQSSTTVNGTYTDVTGAISPYTPPGTVSQTFYRASRQQ